MPQQKKKPSGNTRTVEIDKNLLMRLDLPRRSFSAIWMVQEDTPEDPALMIRCSPPMTAMDLTSMTHVELMQFKTFLLGAIEAAEPITKHLDQVAQDDFENGLGVHRRLYRPPAQLLNFGTPPPRPAPPAPQPDTNEGQDNVHQGINHELLE